MTSGARRAPPPGADAEPAAAKSLFLSWAVPLAAIGPIATLIGFVLLVGGFMLNFALVFVIVLYALILASTWGLAMIVDGMAPSFGSVRNPDRAMKLVCYSLTPFWVAGVLNIIPDLTPIAMLAGLYGVYLLWIGVPVVMKTPADKAPGYVAVTAIVALVLIFASYKIAGAIAASVFRASVMSGFPGLT